jgi:hypothetical protein
LGSNASTASSSSPGTRSSAAGFKNVRILEADARNSGLETDSFDLVHERLVLVNVPERQALISATNVQARLWAELPQRGQYRRTHLITPVNSMHEKILDMNLMSATDLDAHREALAQHLADPNNSRDREAACAMLGNRLAHAQSW